MTTSDMRRVHYAPWPGAAYRSCEHCVSMKFEQKMPCAPQQPSGMAPRDGKPSSTVNQSGSWRDKLPLQPRGQGRVHARLAQHRVPRLAYMKERWRLPKPGIILHVTGSALGFDLPPKHIKPITDGVVDVCEKAGAWVITGGLDAGVMALVGSAMSRWKHRCESAPLIGIAPWRAVTNKGVLENASGRKVEYFAEKRNDDEVRRSRPASSCW